MSHSLTCRYIPLNLQSQAVYEPLSSLVPTPGQMISKLPLALKVNEPKVKKQK